ncbi:MAG TPA: NUDIX domain-containing protein [Acidimicrobiales bacterium]|nr:NUDIX domain-containing protein [Acidimicrobiales bacterium]
MIEALHSLLLRIYRRLPRRARIAVVHTLAPTFTVGAMCVIERPDGAVLLVRHAYRRRWGLPGGLLNRGEDPGVAARREAFEEVGAEIETVGEPAVVVDPKPRRVDVIYRARLVNGIAPDAIKPTSVEIVEVRWFPSEALPELQSETAGALVALARARRPVSPTDEPGR